MNNRPIFRMNSTIKAPLWPSQQPQVSTKPLPPPTIPIPPRVFPPGSGKWVGNPGIPIPPQPPKFYPPGTICKGGVGRFPNCNDYCNGCYRIYSSGSSVSNNNIKTLGPAGDDRSITRISNRKTNVFFIDVQYDKRIDINFTQPSPICELMYTTTTTTTTPTETIWYETTTPTETIWYETTTPTETMWYETTTTTPVETMWYETTTTTPTETIEVSPPIYFT